MKLTTIKSIVAAALCAVGFAAWSEPQQIGDSSTTWELTQGCTVLTIGGSGPMPDFYDPSEAPWYWETTGGEESQEAYRVIAEVKIGSGVTSIGSCAFGNHESLESVTIPSSVESIGSMAFCNCFLLKSVTIPQSVKTIGGYAFTGCQSLESVTIPSGVTSIEDNTFAACSSLSSVTIPSGVKSIGAHAFESCSLSSVTIPSSVESIGGNAFYNCRKLGSVTIPSGVTSIGQYAFNYCIKLSSVTVEATTPPTAGSNIFGSGIGMSADLEITVPKASTAAYRAADGWSTYKDYINPDPVTIDAVAVVTPWDSTKGAISVDYSLAGLDAGGWYKVAFDITAGGKMAGVTNAAAQLVEGAQAQKVIDTVTLFGKETVAKDAKVKVSLIAVKPAK